jgi:hypothetical protein
MKLDIYPRIWDRNPADDDAFGYCMDHFATLKEFVVRASERGVGLIIGIF